MKNGVTDPYETGWKHKGGISIANDFEPIPLFKISENSRVSMENNNKMSYN